MANKGYLMTRGRGALYAVFAISLGSAFGQARAADPLGFYIGGAIGRSHVRADEEVFGSPLGFDEHHNAWKLLVGLRSISLVGAEFEYVNFGHPSALLGPQRSLSNIQADAHAKAVGLFGVVYAPIPLPLLDIYGKAGFARLQTAVNASVVCTAGGDCPPARVGPGPLFYLNRTGVRFAYGAGAQIKFAAFGVRAEYERISASGGDPDLLSLGITWSF
jgi:hypothetical protein